MKTKHVMIFALFFVAVISLNIEEVNAQDNVVASVPMEMYGFVKTNFIYTEGANTAGEGNYLTWTKAEDEDSFHATGRASRLGLKFSDGFLSGAVEIDFLGTTDAHTHSRLRHAYINLDYEDYEFLIGQYWHLTPLELPPAGNDLYLGYSGALWHRVPQGRFTYHLDEKSSFALAVTRQTRKQAAVSATNSAKPMVQSSISREFSFGEVKLTAAVGRAENDTGTEGDIELIDLGYNFEITDSLKVNGQLWKGKNLYSFLGGMGHMGYGEDAEVAARGGFMGISYALRDDLSLNTAYGVDDPDNEDLSAEDRAKNTTYFVNFEKVLAEDLTASLQLSKNKTDYINDEQLESNHYQTSVQYSF